MTHEPPAWSKRSLAAQALGASGETSRAIIAPIHVTTTFERAADNGPRPGFSYGRPDNETVREAEGVIAMLEGGAAAMAFGSGMSAAIALFLTLRPGDHIVAPTVFYWGLRQWLQRHAQDWGLRLTLVDMTDLDALRAAVIPGETKLVWIETPSNPLWGVTDIAAVCAIAHAAGARVGADSTVSSPVLTRPLEYGVDIVMHSATKYLNGHSDVIAGALVAAKADALWDDIATIRATQGMILGPFEAFLLIRGMRTLDLRVRAASASAMAIATRLVEHPAVSHVLYPGLPTHPGHAIAARQMQGGFGGMLSFRLRGGRTAAISTAARVALWRRATSLGGVESLIEHRASIEGPSSPVPDDLLRLSCGVEDPDDLLRDLDQAMR